MISLLQTTQILVCSLIALRLLTFRSPASSHKPLLAALAYALIIAAAAIPIKALFQIASPISPAALFLQIALCAALFCVRGNLAQLFFKRNKDKKMRILILGSQGQDVSELQYLLTTAGFKVLSDGWFGEVTHAVLMKFQHTHGLVVDGIAGPKTLSTLRTKRRAPYMLAEADLLAAAEQLDIPLSTIKAINAVESRGSGFLENGRAVILFERHKMYEFLKEAGLNAEELAEKYPNLVNSKRGGYSGGQAEWLRFDMAKQIHAESAIKATSWGLFQIMGMHWQALGYESAEDMKQAMGISEGGQLDAFVRFIKSEEALLKAIKAKKWAEVARLYNGPAYKENLYDVKLARAAEKFEAMA